MGAQGPDPGGRGWKKAENPTRWNWHNWDVGIAFTVSEKPGPGVMIYSLRLLNDHGMFKHIKPFQWRTPEGAFAAAARDFPGLAGEQTLFVMDHWSKA